jgi:metal-sulfur cluster biosynthetic enzyme
VPSRDAGATKDDVLASLRRCYDPETPLNVVDLGLIDGVEVEGRTAIIRMMMTTRCSPAQAWLQGEIKRRAEGVDGIDRAHVDVVWEPRWTPKRITRQGRSRLKLGSQE